MESLLDKLFRDHQECSNCPSPIAIQAFFTDLLSLLFPEFLVKRLSRDEISEELSRLETSLAEILERNQHLHSGNGSDLSNQFFRKLDEVYSLVHQDVEAMFQGDPAAKSKTEIIRSYPGFYAIAAYRIAHVIQKLGIQLIPRIITEFAHSRTGIDIHPGATIGPYFCIDHGTGIVIGETTIIGSNVKIYQGVTLGALSVEKADADIKRHPTIEDNVVIYAGATILGGNTKVGRDSIIGGNVWLTHSVAPESKVYYQSRMNYSDSEISDTIVFKPNTNETK